VTVLYYLLAYVALGAAWAWILALLDRHRALFVTELFWCGLLWPVSALFIAYAIAFSGRRFA
jgi:hypothetical protein